MMHAIETSLYIYYVRELVVPLQIWPSGNSEVCPLTPNRDFNHRTRVDEHVPNGKSMSDSQALY